jgi:hypothetical protein
VKPTRYADGTVFGRPDLKNIVMGVYPTLQHGNVLIVFLPIGENYGICAWGSL